MLAKNFASRPAAHALAAAALVLAGCTSLAPPYATPVLPVAPRYALEAVASSDASTRERPAWRSYFADPQLQALLAQALEQQLQRQQDEQDDLLLQRQELQAVAAFLLVRARALQQV